jgi:hypothetical protein
MTRPLDDDTGTSTPGAARAKREHLYRDGWRRFAVEDSGATIRVTYADGDESTWLREGSSDWYRRTS